MKQTLLDLYRSEEVEISNKPDAIHSKIFHHPIILNTYTGLRFSTLNLLSQLEEFDHLLIVAETGEWLLNPRITEIISNKNVCLFLILADFSRLDKLKETFPSNISKIKQIPWWTHNKHMTLICRGRTAYRSIFFGRRLRAMKISPVYLNEHDTSAVFESFIAYWIKSDWYANRPKINRNKLNDQASLFDMLNQ